MFGYVKPVHTELLVKEYEFYRATYCGICRAMKKHTGTFSNVTLSYDSVFLALVRMLFVEDSEISAHNKRCIAHPMKKRTMLKENSALEYTARAFAILSYLILPPICRYRRHSFLKERRQAPLSGQNCRISAPLPLP